MENYCKLCGEVLEAGQTSAQHHQFKKMCLNCEWSKHVVEGDETSDIVCTNEDNRTAVANKMFEAASAVTESYSVDHIEISPLPLKKPFGKCKHWELDPIVKEGLVNLFA